jgi:hypothetical protein
MSGIITDIKDIKDVSIKSIYKEIIDLEVPKGKQAALNASDALSKPGWSKWLEQREMAVSRVAQFKANNSIAGKIVDLSEFNQQEFIVECYESYLRAASRGEMGRSKTTFVVENGRTVGKKVLDMTFIDFLNDCLRNLNWRKQKDLPYLLQREAEGLIGISKVEYDKTMAVIDMSVVAIHNYLAMPAHKRLIYV